MKKIGTLVKKEITEILRDKKTLIIMILVPLLLYPILIIGISVGMTMLMQAQQEEEHTVVYAIEDEAYMKPLISLYEQKKEEIDYELTFEAASKDKADTLKIEENVWVSFQEKENSIQIQVDYTSTNNQSSYAESGMQALIDEYRDMLIMQNLQKEGLSEAFIYPVTYESIDSVSESESMGMSLGGTIGMSIIVMILMGAFYPAADVVTGEKERGTLETLLTLPVTNFQMIMSKFIAVSIMACITAVMTLLALGGSILLLLAGAEVETSGISAEALFGGIPIMVLALVTTALLLTAFCMCICVFAKSTKEANNYISPFMMVVMFASMVGMIPTVELDYTLALIPIINVSLLIKQIFAQQTDMILACMTIGINTAYSVLIIWILSKMYDSEEILFSDGFKSFRLFQKREHIKKGTIPAVGDVLISLVVVVLVMLYMGSIVATKCGAMISVMAQQLMILIVPLALAWYMKSDMKKLFCLKKPMLKMIPGNILLYIGTYLLVLVASTLLTAIFPESAQTTATNFDILIKSPFALVTFVIAVMPAVGEELLFRGLTFSSLQEKQKIGWAIVISSLIFGAFHFSIVKLIPTAMLGACFAYIVYKGGSIYVTMFLHFLNNFISVVQMKKSEVIAQMMPFMTKETISETELILIMVIGIICLAAGFLLMNGKQKEVCESCCS